MFKNIKNLFKSKNENSRAFRMEMAEKISNKIIKYTAERVDDVELVIGREGSISLRNGRSSSSPAATSSCGPMWRICTPPSCSRLTA